MVIPPLPWKLLGKIIAVAAAVAAVYFGITLYGKARFEAGVLDERLVWEMMVAEEKQAIADAQRAADAVLAAARVGDTERMAEERKELDNAVADIPDQGTTDRQRARACLELRRQGNAPATCTDAAP